MFNKLPPAVSVPLFYGFATTALMYRFLFGNLFGILISCLTLHYFSEAILGVVPLNFDEVMMWIVVQGEPVKIAVLSSLITVVGFLIAYATATSNWKSQLLANIKMQAAGEIEVFFSECSSLASGCKIYADMLIKDVRKINNGSSHDAVFLAKFNRDQGQVFIKNRERIIQLGIDVYRLHGKFGLLLASAPTLRSDLESATKALTNITEKVWINVPFHLHEDENTARTFLKQVNLAECLEFSKVVKDNFDELNVSSGKLRGHLMSTVVGFNFWHLFYLFKDREDYKEIISGQFKKTQ